MRSLWVKLIGLFRRRPSIHIPTGTPFPLLDIETIKKFLRLSERGKERGSRNFPSSDATSLDEVETQIIATVEDEKRRSYQDYVDYLKTFKDRLLNLDLQPRAAEIDACALNAIGNLHARVREGQDYLFDLKRMVTQVEKEFSDFRGENKLNGTPSLPESTVFYWGLILGFILIESLLNGNFLARGAELGFLGGVMYALSISVFNVGFGLAVGKCLLPNLYHRKVYRKVIGVSGTFVYLLAALAFNLRTLDIPLRLYDTWPGSLTP